MKKLTKQCLAGFGIDGVEASILDVARRLRSAADEIEVLRIPRVEGESQQKRLNEVLVLSKRIVELGHVLDDCETAYRQFTEQYYEKN